jgi:hypothetical protein
VSFVEDPLCNPLYLATDHPNTIAQLEQCPDLLTNFTQRKPLLAFSSTPFCRLTVRGRAVVPADVMVVTPTGDRGKRVKGGAGKGMKRNLLEKHVVVEEEEEVGVRGAAIGRRRRRVE